MKLTEEEAREFVEWIDEQIGLLAKEGRGKAPGVFHSAGAMTAALIITKHKFLGLAGKPE